MEERPAVGCGRGGEEKTRGFDGLEWRSVEDDSRLVKRQQAVGVGAGGGRQVVEDRWWWVSGAGESRECGRECVGVGGRG